MPRGFEVEGATELRVLAAELRAARPAMVKGLTKALNESVKPIVPEVRRAALAIPAKDSGEISQASLSRAGKVRAKSFGAALGRSGLRARISAAVRTSTRITPRSVSLAIRVDSSQLPDDQRRLPKYMDGIGRWRHPTWGHDPWVTQDPHPYFRKTILPHIPEVYARVRRVMAETSRAAGFHSRF